MTLYWHIINHSPHIPKSNSYWHNIVPLFPAINNDFWKNIYKSPFNIVREIRLQTLQYKIIHNTIACNQWLKRIKIKESDTCSFCNLPDDIHISSLTVKLVKVSGTYRDYGGKN